MVSPLDIDAAALLPLDCYPTRARTIANRLANALTDVAFTTRHQSTPTYDGAAVKFADDLRMRPPLRYHGGKWLLAPWIIGLMPPHRVYVEPYGGGASVLMRKERSYAEVYNDRWDVVVNVFRVLRDPVKATDLVAALELTPFARTEFLGADDDAGVGILSNVERARRTILRSMAGFGSAATNGDHITGFRSNSNRSGTTPAMDWRNYPAHIPAFVERLQGVVIENRDALSVIRQHDTPDTLHFVDPPYPHSTRNMRRGNAAYAYEMSDGDHEELGALLLTVEGAVLLSSYPNALYDKMFAGWQRFERTTLADGANERLEVLWRNPRAAALAADNHGPLFEDGAGFAKAD